MMSPCMRMEQMINRLSLTLFSIPAAISTNTRPSNRLTRETSYPQPFRSFPSHNKIIHAHEVRRILL
ncbi:hypothetical protein TrVE_jg10907 [Triparma verrucosa]|uniref:Uncharacterized protein n=1 Tax=Triparma verrucosa TaxID=1606542 RepID=A0A9W7KW33_9STRA|nr:hypothetical protein TrVE_jg10907 [Triparma verrucosa]